MSGRETGTAPDLDALAQVREAVGDATIVIGSGLDVDRAEELLARADAAIVGTSLKFDARVEEPVDEQRVRKLCERVAALRRS